MNFLPRLNFLSLAKIAIAAAGDLPGPSQAIAFLETEASSPQPSAPCSSAYD